MQNLISFDKISKSFKKNEVLKNISFNIKEGEFFGLIGPSGAGKTTILKIILGVYKPSNGKLSINDDKDITKIFGFASQENSFYEKLTVRENLLLFGELYRVDKSILRNRIENLLLVVGLKEAEDVLANNLSGGMKRRLDLACALVHDPDILVLDEPTSNLDPLLKKEILALIERIHLDGKTIIMSSHALEEIEHLCNRVLLLNKGQIIKIDSPMALRNSYSKTDEFILESFPGNYDLITRYLRSLDDVDFIRCKNGKLLFSSSYPKKTLQFIINLLNHLSENIVELRVNKIPFDEAFDILVKQNYYNEYGKAFVESYLKHGYSKDQIKEKLVERGWPTSIIVELLK